MYTEWTPPNKNNTQFRRTISDSNNINHLSVHFLQQLHRTESLINGNSCTQLIILCSTHRSNKPHSDDNWNAKWIIQIDWINAQNWEYGLSRIAKINGVQWHKTTPTDSPIIQCCQQLLINVIFFVWAHNKQSVPSIGHGGRGSRDRSAPDATT